MPAHPPAADAVERLERCLAVIRARDPLLKAMTTVDEAGARAAAEAADRAARDGRSLGLLHGVPLVVKDNIDTAGLRTTYGSRFFEHHVPTADAPVVQRLRRAGAVIVGKSTLHEFAFGTRSTSPVVGQVRNPWDPSRIPGGSSGGSAVALATGMAEMALGSDTGASVRLPASLTGVSGLRPTTGRVPNRGSFPLSPTHDVIGPMAREVDDVARLFTVIAGHDPDDPSSRSRPVPECLAHLDDGIAGVRIGRPRRHFFEGLDDAVAAAVEVAIHTLERLGATVVDVDLPGAEEVPAWYPVILGADARAIHADRLGPEHEATWDPQTLDRMRRSAAFTGADYARALRFQERWTHTVARVFAHVDLLVSPTNPVVAPPIDDTRSLFDSTKALSKNNVTGSFARIPGLSVPCGFSPDGLPIGLQLESARWNEPLLLRAGRAYQSVTEWHRRRPG